MPLCESSIRLDNPPHKNKVTTDGFGIDTLQRWRDVRHPEDPNSHHKNL
jgi:hypothetical protein